ncbi:hypothetical protein C0991_002323 [Blastosporella zonata]|nr:hypothetical protein C0991_002323 [Blastosporella zonata]
MAEWTEHTSSAVPDYVMGQYVINDAGGIRNYPYSTSKYVSFIDYKRWTSFFFVFSTTNPLRYSSIKTLNEVHNIGEVWANLLHNVYAALVDAYGWSATAKTNPSGTEGNVVFLHLFLDALPLQPCSPTFASARDAWIQADVNRYGGANKCILWKAFASRGLGVGAAKYADSTTLPTSLAAFAFTPSSQKSPAHPIPKRSISSGLLKRRTLEPSDVNEAQSDVAESATSTGSTEPVRSPKKKKRVRGYADPETYAHLQGLPDVLIEDLDGKISNSLPVSLLTYLYQLFSGFLRYQVSHPIISWTVFYSIDSFFSPGEKSAEIGHHYGHHSNHFWDCLHQSGICLHYT